MNTLSANTNGSGAGSTGNGNGSAGGSTANATTAGSAGSGGNGGGGGGGNLDELGGDASSRRQATRVFKKSSSNGKITVYLGKRDFVDHVTHVDPIDGVVFIDPEYVKDRKVFGQVLAAFRYGREDLDVLGLTFRKDLYLAHEQIYPPMQMERPMTRLQERLIKKLGPNAHPFYFEVPPYCPASVSLQPAPGDVGKSCGVDYELKAFVVQWREKLGLAATLFPHMISRLIMYSNTRQCVRNWLCESKLRKRKLTRIRKAIFN
ncbi:beta-arrestin-1 isoform X3 [Drosophila virilis]|uniref:beta-arrestin-1 isoform X3 n=1 Tax=Drosophila virilis TaxID=7244 RepID=UPI001395CC59|nr:beta-arrestin-1 isoform X2 [Drosophila virilis]